MAGARFGHALLWAIAFSIVATIVLQEMSARLGLVSRQGLGEALRSTFPNRLVRGLSILLVLAAIAFGMPLGGDLEYADHVTVGICIENRRTIE